MRVSLYTLLLAAVLFAADPPREEEGSRRLGASSGYTSLEYLEYPMRRGDCPSDFKACIVGDREMADMFDINTERPMVQDLQATGMFTIEEKSYTLPEGYVIDYTGGLGSMAGRYVVPDQYENADFGITFIKKEVTIRVTEDSFQPANVSIQPGTRLTWFLDTYETVHLRSDDDGKTFDSGRLNRNWAPDGYTVVFDHEFKPIGYENIAKEVWEYPVREDGTSGRPRGRLGVEGYNCTAYDSCTSCLIYPMCMWCAGDEKCVERNETNNMPVATNVIAKIAPGTWDEDKDYEFIRYTSGYSMELDADIMGWFPYPSQRRVPRVVPDREVPDYLEPVRSDSCSLYLNTRNAEICPDYKTPPPKDRIADWVETPDRPQLAHFLACYYHLRETWAQPYREGSSVKWVVHAPPAAPGAPAPGLPAPPALLPPDCCEMCIACSLEVLRACEVPCAGRAENATAANATTAEEETADEVVVCPLAGAEATAALRRLATCAASETTCPNDPPVNATCPLDDLNATLRAAGMMDENNERIQRRRLDDVNATLEPPPLDDERDAAFIEAGFDLIEGYTFGGGLGGGGGGLGDGGDDRGGGGDGDGPRLEKWAQEVVDSGVQYRELSTMARASRGRELQRSRFQIIITDMWEYVPKWQQNTIDRKTKGNDRWAEVIVSLEALYGPRCNATERCDDLRGVCLNVSSLPIHGYDQNGTCRCHPFFTGRNCDRPITEGDACAGIGNIEDCKVVRQKLFLCGTPHEDDELPPDCREQGLTVVECGEAGYFQGRPDRPSPDESMLGTPEAGYAVTVCARCMSTAGNRPETGAKQCNTPEFLAQCQRMEDITGQRVCNQCTEDTGGAIPQADPTAGGPKCSFFRGTCMGSVEKRIRGIVPPNVDIIGHNRYGGLRYCKKQTTYTSAQHYFTEDDIMQAGQSCINHKKMWTNWDFSRAPLLPEEDHPDHKFHPEVVSGKWGLTCKHPEDPIKCPRARICVPGVDCFEDHKDFTDWRTMRDSWGVMNLALFSDQVLRGESLLNYRVTELSFASHKTVLDPPTAYLQPGNWPFLNDKYVDHYLANIDFGLKPLCFYEGTCAWPPVEEGEEGEEEEGEEEEKTFALSSGRLFRV